MNIIDRVSAAYSQRDALTGTFDMTRPLPTTSFMMRKLPNSTVHISYNNMANSICMVRVHYNDLMGSGGRSTNGLAGRQSINAYIHSTCMHYPRRVYNKHKPPHDFRQFEPRAQKTKTLTAQARQWGKESFEWFLTHTHTHATGFH